MHTDKQSNKTKYQECRIIDFLTIYDGQKKGWQTKSCSFWQANWGEDFQTFSTLLMRATTSKTKSWIYQKRKEKKENELRLTHRLSVPKALQKGPWSLLSSAYVHCQSGSEVSREYLSFYKNMFKCFGLAEYELIPQIWVPGKRWPGHTMNVLNPWCMCVSLLSRWSFRAVSPHILPPNYIFIGTSRCMVPQKTSKF